MIPELSAAEYCGEVFFEQPQRGRDKNSEMKVIDTIVLSQTFYFEISPC
jgi:hypothetical protein